MTTKISYPECEKLEEVANVHSTLMGFTEWLEYNGYSIEKEGRSVNASTVVYPFMKIDIKKLEQERRSILNQYK
jgi:hypothetical protein